MLDVSHQPALDWLNRTFFAAATPPPPPGPPRAEGGVSLDDDALIRRMHDSANGAKIAGLWAGDSGADHSAADLALCFYLAFWCNNDPVRMDRLFRQSGLMRPKWDESHSATGETYGSMTIAKAMASCREGFQPGRAEYRQRQESAHPGDSGRTEAPEPPTDRGRKKADNPTQHDIAMQWITGRSSPGPVAADGQLWEFRDGLYRVTHRHEVEADLGARFGEYELCRTKSHYGALYRHIEDIKRSEDFFESAPVGLMTPGGFFEPSEAGIRRREPAADLRQRFTALVTPANIPTPLFDQYLDATFHHANDDRVIEQQMLLQELIGAALVGALHPFEKAVYLYGRQRAGKSTLLRIIEKIVPSELTAAVSPFKWDEPYSRAALAGVRINLIGELPRDRVIPASDFKAIIGRDRIDARFPYGRPFSFRACAAHFVNSNHFISTKDQHPAFFDRWLIVHFANTVATGDRDPDLDKKIISQELPGVLWWALEGAERLMRAGAFTRSKEHEEVLEKWRNSSDSIAAFIAEECSKTGEIIRGHLFDAYTGWCEQEERKPYGKKTFFQRIEELGYLISPDADGNYTIKGLSKKPR